MFLLTRKGMIRGFGICMALLGFYILANIAVLTHIYVNYYDILGQTLAKDIGPIWLRLIFEPLSGAVIGTTLIVVGMGFIKLRKWSRIMALALMYINFFILACWIAFTQFQHIDPVRFAQVLMMYGLIIIFLSLKWVKVDFS